MHKVLFIVVVVLFFSCKEQEEEKPNYIPTKEELIQINIGWTEEENLMIDNYVRRRSWPMIITGTGIRYFIYKPADTTLPKVKEDDLVSVNFEIRLMENDSVCYSSEGVPVEFKVGMDHVESGLHEVITYLRVGDKAKIIMPYHRAFGLVGDMDQIPPQAALVYDLEVVANKTEE